MGKKKNNGGNNENNKKEANDATAENKVSLKIDIHCEGCIRDIDKCLWDSRGVESVKISREKGTVTITGSKEMNPLKVVQRLQKKTKKIPTLLPPQPQSKKESNGGGGEGGDKKNNNGNPGAGGEGGEKKNNNGNPGAGGEGGDKKNNTGGGGGGKGEKKKDNDSGGGDQKGKDAKKSDEKGVLILKIDPPCQGCFKRAMKLIRKTKGEVIKVEVSAAKDAITVKGTKKALEFVKEKLPKTVKTTVPPPPKKDGAAGKDKNGGGGGKNGEAFQIAGLPSRFGYAWSPSSMAGFSEGGSTAAVYPPELEPAPGIPSGYGAGYVYGPGFGYAVYRAPAPQMFSDENPNACSVM